MLLVNIRHPMSCEEEDSSTPLAEISFKVIVSWISYQDVET